MRHFLISTLLLSLVAGCSSVNIGPHRIDVQQGNALDQENVSRLKPGLNRSQVRFLLGTPLVVDPFRTDRWDYVYVNYKAGKLAEQKRITLFFDGDTLARIEGDVPVAEPVEKVPALRRHPFLCLPLNPSPKSKYRPCRRLPKPGPRRCRSCLKRHRCRIANRTAAPQPVAAPAMPEKSRACRGCACCCGSGQQGNGRAISQPGSGSYGGSCGNHYACSTAAQPEKCTGVCRSPPTG